MSRKPLDFPLIEAVTSGDYRESLVATRDWIAREIGREADASFCESCKRGQGGTAPLAKLLVEVLDKLRDLKEPQSGDDPDAWLDDLPASVRDASKN